MTDDNEHDIARATGRVWRAGRRRSWRQRARLAWEMHICAGIDARVLLAGVMNDCKVAKSAFRDLSVADSADAQLNA
jgi:hypothetical protein